MPYRKRNGAAFQMQVEMTAIGRIMRILEPFNAEDRKDLAERALEFLDRYDRDRPKQVSEPGRVAEVIRPGMIDARQAGHAAIPKRQNASQGPPVVRVPPGASRRDP